MKWVRVLIFIGLALLTLAALVVTFENWRGKRAWFKFKNEWEAKGERFDLASLLPKPIADSENFAATPFFAPFFRYHHTNDPPVIVWHDSNGLDRAQSTTLSGVKEGQAPTLGSRAKTNLTDLKLCQDYYRSNQNFSLPAQNQSPAADILHALSKYDAVLAELREAGKRPQSAFPIHYDESFYAMLPHLATLKSLCNILRLRTLASLAENRPAEAVADVRLSLRLADSLKSEPLLISHLVRLAILSITADTVWEGLSTGRWNDQHLAEIQSAFSSIELLADYHFALRGERAFGADIFDKMRAGHQFIGEDDLRSISRYAPDGFLYHNQLVLFRLHQKYSFHMIDPERRRVYVDRANQADDPPEVRTRHPYNIMSRLLFPALSKAAGRFAQAQTSVDQAALACALERYRTAHGQYPEALAALKPRFVRAIPHDIITGEALHYSRIKNDEFVLYSVGWNEKDDQGTPAPRSGSTARKNGDWVWTPAPPSSILR
jgi:hypothetical protein